MDRGSLIGSKPGDENWELRRGTWEMRVIFFTEFYVNDFTFLCGNINNFKGLINFEGIREFPNHDPIIHNLLITQQS